jgi:hypothetical protein
MAGDAIPNTSDPTRTILLVAVAAILLFASVSVWYAGQAPEPPGKHLPANGSTFFRASQESEAVVANESGGPWALVSVVGIAATGPVLPLPTGSPLAACQELRGPSIWNASRVSFYTDDFSSGRIPFWSLVYHNGSGFLLPVVVAAGSVNNIGPIGPGTPCGKSLHSTFATAQTIGATADSPGIAQAAWASAGEAFVANSYGMVLYYTLGESQLTVLFSGSNWGLTFTPCGLATYPFWQEDLFVGLNSTTGSVIGASSGMMTCTIDSYFIAFQNRSTVPGGNGSVLDSFQLVVNGSGSSSDAIGLATWLLGLMMSNTASGAGEPPASVQCAGIVFTKSTCQAVSHGWYAALATPAGYWVDLYSDQNGSSSWTLATVPVYTGDILTIFLPQDMARITQTITTSSMSGEIPITGAISF